MDNIIDTRWSIQRGILYRGQRKQECPFAPAPKDEAHAKCGLRCPLFDVQLLPPDDARIMSDATVIGFATLDCSPANHTIVRLLHKTGLEDQ